MGGFWFRNFVRLSSLSFSMSAFASASAFLPISKRLPAARPALSTSRRFLRSSNLSFLALRLAIAPPTRPFARLPTKSPPVSRFLSACPPVSSFLTAALEPILSRPSPTSFFSVSINAASCLDLASILALLSSLALFTSFSLAAASRPARRSAAEVSASFFLVLSPRS